jgi:hypothetical protein
MKPGRQGTTMPLTAEQQLRAFIAGFEPEHQALFRSLRRALRRRFPTANELVYDYPTSLVIGYAPGERGSDAVVAMALGADGLRLYFNQGPALPDPKKILLGSGKQTRFIRIESAKTLNLPEVEALMEAAIDRARASLPGNDSGRLVIKSNSAKQRPGRKPKR